VRRARLLRPLLPLIVLAALLPAVELALQAGEDGRARHLYTERVATDLTRDLARIRALQWSARADRSRAGDARAEVTGVGRAASARLDVLADTGNPEARALRTATAALLADVNRELAGGPRAVDRAFLRVTRTVTRVQRSARERAADASARQRGRRRVLLGLSAVLVVLLIGLVQRTARRHAATTETRRLRALLERSSDGTVVLGPKGVVLDLTAPLRRLVPALQPGTQFADVVHLDDRPELPLLWERLLERPGASARASFRVRHGSGGWRDVEAVGTNLSEDPDVRGVAVNLRDVSDRMRLERELRHLAYVDVLTGLANRAALLDRLDALLRNPPPGVVSVHFVDLDDFKAVNDGLGHPVGDEVLTQVAQRLRHVVGDQGLVARGGGDEFVVVGTAQSSEEAARLSRRIHAAVARPTLVAGFELPVGASVGLACASPEDATDAVDLMRRADIAMYVAKQRGGGTAEYRPEDDPQAADRLALLADLRQELAAGCQIELAFQPQVDVASGALRGVEALVRWRHPQRGLLSPAHFVPLAERTGLIGELTHRVLKLALEARSRWVTEGLSVPVAVNLSAASLLDAAFPTSVERLLNEHGTEPSALCLEITETLLVGDQERAALVLHGLHKLGVELSIDDFGTGHSSLTRLRQLRLDELKVDRTFVMEMHRDPESLAIVRSTVHLARDLGMRVVAEGVDQEEHWPALAEMGCDLAQGYGVARPMPGGELVAWATARAAALA